MFSGKPVSMWRRSWRLSWMGYARPVCSEWVAAWPLTGSEPGTVTADLSDAVAFAPGPQGKPHPCGCAQRLPSPTGRPGDPCLGSSAQRPQSRGYRAKRKKSPPQSLRWSGGRRLVSCANGQTEPAEPWPDLGWCVLSFHVSCWGQAALAEQAWQTLG